MKKKIILLALPLLWNYLSAELEIRDAASAPIAGSTKSSDDIGKEIGPGISNPELPATTPWDLEALSRPPEFEWSDGNQIRSLYYQSEPYNGKTTRVFAH